MADMADTALYEEDIIAREVASPIAARMAGGTPFSWSAAIAGVFAAMAVSFIIIALGSGIGLSFASPYGGPTATTLTIAAAVWLVMAQAMGFATGGYVAARLRSPAYDGLAGETTFRDGAEGLVVWALGVVIMVVVTGTLAILAASAGARMTAAASGGVVAPSAAAAASAAAQVSASPIDYFVDLMFRPPPGAAAGQSQEQQPQRPATIGMAAAAAQPLSPESRAEVTRILARGMAAGKLDDNDRTYLAQLVSMRTGLAAQEAQQRVTMVENDARESIKAAADKAATAGAFFSFWTFMALLFGGAAATLAGMLGGQIRDEEGRLAEGSESLAGS
jgi:hypothetical protein